MPCLPSPLPDPTIVIVKSQAKAENGLIIGILTAPKGLGETTHIAQAQLLVADMQRKREVSAEGEASGAVKTTERAK